MPIPGYDPDDLDAVLAERVEKRGAESVLTPAQRREYESGASLVDLLDEEEIRRLLRGGE
ncbi:hypothetical protein [Halegenticoccus soli]|uniref:hypothetical protein n=1 Tax=Halegenticoccus soli TaxID=1985678 RepID=UPI000C6D58F2|nr:hypothetical protein [Halegenticoccus soli]